jgi:hypothetical protein
MIITFSHLSFFRPSLAGICPVLHLIQFVVSKLINDPMSKQIYALALFYSHSTEIYK